MAFTPTTVDYVGHQQLRGDALNRVTKAKLATKLRKEEEERRAAAARAASKKKSSFGSKIAGAVVRGAAAYYTGGASEATGLGSMLDQQLRGGDAYERNEYGDLVGAVASTSGVMTGKKVADATMRLNAQARRDDEMQARLDKISPEAGLAYAERREAKDAKNRGVFEDYKKGFLNFGQDIDGLDLSATTMDYSGITSSKKVGKTPDVSQYEEEGPLGSGPVAIEEAAPEAAAEGFEGTDTAPDPGFLNAMKPVDQVSTNLPSNRNENFGNVMNAPATPTNQGPEDQRVDDSEHNMRNEGVLSGNVKSSPDEKWNENIW